MGRVRRLVGRRREQRPVRSVKDAVDCGPSVFPSMYLPWWWSCFPYPRSVRKRGGLRGSGGGGHWRAFRGEVVLGSSFREETRWTAEDQGWTSPSCDVSESSREYPGGLAAFLRSWTTEHVKCERTHKYEVFRVLVRVCGRLSKRVPMGVDVHHGPLSVCTTLILRMPVGRGPCASPWETGAVAHGTHILSTHRGGVLGIRLLSDSARAEATGPN